MANTWEIFGKYTRVQGFEVKEMNTFSKSNKKQNNLPEQF